MAASGFFGLPREHGHPARRPGGFCVAQGGQDACASRRGICRGANEPFWGWEEAEAKRIAAEEATKNLHEQFKRENPPQTPFELRAIKQEFSDVLARPAARERARGYFLSAREEAVESRKPFNEIEAHRAALSRAAQEMGMRQPPVARPSDAQRGRLAGVSSTGVSAGGTGPMRSFSN